jgi:hypothetical protein
VFCRLVLISLGAEVVQSAEGRDCHRRFIECQLVIHRYVAQCLRRPHCLQLYMAYASQELNRILE